jgi:hypothetical protein
MSDSTFDLSSERDGTAAEDAGIAVIVRKRTGDIATFTKDGETIPATMRVVGTYSKRYREALSAQRKRIFEARRQQVPDLIESQQVELVADCVLGWEGLTDKGTDIPFTRANAIALLTACPWIREACQEAMGDHAGFTRSSSSD